MKPKNCGECHFRSKKGNCLLDVPYVVVGDAWLDKRVDTAWDWCPVVKLLAACHAQRDRAREAERQFRVCQDDMDIDLFWLLETVNPVDCLNEVVELISNAKKDGICAMPLEVATTSRNDWLCR